MYIFRQEMELCLRFKDLGSRISELVCQFSSRALHSQSTWTSRREYSMSPPNMAPEAGRLELSWQVQLDLHKSMASDGIPAEAAFSHCSGIQSPSRLRKPKWSRQIGNEAGSLGSPMGLLGLVSPENCIIVQHANCPALRLHPRTEPSHISSCELAGHNATILFMLLCFLLSHA
jgi:hypothetical protein